MIKALILFSILLTSCVPQTINVVSDTGICLGERLEVTGWDSEIYYVDPNRCVILEEAPDMYFDENGGEL